MMMLTCNLFTIFSIDYDFRGEGVRKPLLKKLDEVKPPKLSYLGTSFGFTQQLLKFWRKNGYQPVYMRQTVNDITS
jgi:tRNA(Met) C34 N-acetyltransferase TmcA